MEGQASRGRMAAWEWLRTIFALPLILLLYVGFVASIPILVVVCLGYEVSQLIGEGRFHRHLRKAGRSVRLRDFRATIPSGSGTLILEVIPGKYWDERAWWTPEDVVAEAPCSLPHESALCSEEAEDPRTNEYSRFCASVYQRYLSLDEGTALLVEDGGRDFPDEAAANRICLWHLFGEHKVAWLDDATG